MGAPQQSWLRSDPSKTSTSLCPSAPVCPPPHPPSAGEQGLTAPGMPLGTRDRQMRWHREQGQGRARIHRNGYALCQCGSMGFLSGPLAVLIPEQL